MKRILLIATALFLNGLTVSAKTAPAVMTQSSSSAATDYAMQQQILFPQPDGNFHGEGEVTRLEFTLATVDTLYADENFDGCFQAIAPDPHMTFTLLFNDVQRDNWFGKRLCVAMRDGLVGGDRDGNFRPFASITAAEASKILAHAYGLLYPSLQPTHKEWYDGPMLALSMHGALSSKTKPDALLTRTQMAQMFYALRNEQRFPETRIIGTRGEKTASVEVAPAVMNAPLPQKEEKPEATPQTSVDDNAAVIVSSPSRPSHRLLQQQVKTRWEEDQARLRVTDAQVSAISQ